MSETYYEILGIAPDASEEEIKRAYRSKAVKCHPDKKPDDEKAEKTFLEAAEAYEVLKDPEKRATYDKEITSKKPPSKYERFRKGTDLKINIKVKFEEMIAQKKIIIRTERKKLCPTCEGTGSAEKKLDDCIYCNGTGLQGFALVMGNIKKCHYCLGAGSKPRGKKCPTCGGSALVTETIQREIKLNPISRIYKINQLGNCCFKGRPGDLYIELNVEKDIRYKVKNLNVSSYIKISPAQAILGDTLKLSVFNKEISFKILPGTQNNAVIKVDGGGISYKNETGKFLGIVHVVIPTVISNKEKDLYEKIINIEREIPCQKTLSA